MSLTQKLLRGTEFTLLFVGLPLTFYFDWLPIPKIAGLLIVTIGCMLILWSDSSYRFLRLLYRPAGNPLWKELLKRAGWVAIALLGLVLVTQPGRILEFPLQRPVIWGIVMVLYPVLSAFPQELLYREFFFQRYRELFKSEWVLVVLSAISFSFLHIIYDNWWAIALSLIGGFLFARTYWQTRSLFWVSMEHAIYGCLVFTIGMGNYFYEGF